MRIEDIDRMYFWEDFKKLVEALVENIYGDVRYGMEIYEKKYGAISFYKNYVKRKNYYILVAFEESKPIGFLSGRKFERYSYIYDIVVEEARRGQGIGKALVETFESLVGRPIRADVQEKALRFFEKLGFKVLNTYVEDNVVWYSVILE